MKLKLLYLCIPLVPIEFIALYTDYHWHSLLGFIPYIMISILISYYIFKHGLKEKYGWIISRITGIVISFICAYLFINTYYSANYFKPLTADLYAVLLGLISFIVIAITYFVMWGCSSKNH
ncbi:hypothetical protein B4W72_09140 [Staphylococcus delphini]|uniref:Uncharacterized protein n=1 Tax=Staphylococcus delphini TaxID=53344 RepID=A0A2A4GVB2_9STAP|nr:hypothetical protein B5C08_09985 [Staphylococcus delphini]PCF63089.1 hypothetical protein B5C01_02975 [Staphylococcus delphini]PCF72038.1 hypothetical protein B4W72_09140 [Staphylococcus delphini]